MNKPKVEKRPVGTWRKSRRDDRRKTGWIPPARDTGPIRSVLEVDGRVVAITHGARGRDRTVWWGARLRNHLTDTWPEHSPWEANRSQRAAERAAEAWVRDEQRREAAWQKDRDRRRVIALVNPILAAAKQALAFLETPPADFPTETRIVAVLDSAELTAWRQTQRLMAALRDAVEGPPAES